MNIRVGFGYDAHCLVTDRKLVLGGVEIPSTVGCLAHSDGDALIHALMDAMLGAAGLRDIGTYFPDSSSEFKNIDSKILLKKTFDLIQSKGYKIGNADITVLTEKPKLSSYIPAMIKTLSSLLQIGEEDITVKAGTNEKMGFIGREEGLAAYAVVLLIKS